MPSALIRVLGEPVSTDSGTLGQDGQERHPGGPAEGSQARRPPGAGLCWKAWEAARAGLSQSCVLGGERDPQQPQGARRPRLHKAAHGKAASTAHTGQEEGQDPVFPPHPS